MLSSSPHRIVLDNFYQNWFKLLSNYQGSFFHETFYPDIGKISNFEKRSLGLVAYKEHCIKRCRKRSFLKSVSTFSFFKGLEGEKYIIANSKLEKKIKINYKNVGTSRLCYYKFWRNANLFKHCTKNEVFQ